MDRGVQRSRLWCEQKQERAGKDWKNKVSRARAELGRKIRRKRGYRRGPMLRIGGHIGRQSGRCSRPTGAIDAVWTESAGDDDHAEHRRRCTLFRSRFMDAEATFSSSYILPPAHTSPGSRATTSQVKNSTRHNFNRNELQTASRCCRRRDGHSVDYNCSPGFGMCEVRALQLRRS